MVSYNPNDIANGYCGNCHAYTGVVAEECDSFTEAEIRDAMSRHYPEVVAAFGDISCHCSQRGVLPFTADHLLDVLRSPT